MIWNNLKTILSDNNSRDRIINYFNIMKCFGIMGNGTAGQIGQYIINKILNSNHIQKPQNLLYYFNCGKWWNKYSKKFKAVPEASDLILVKIKQPVKQINYDNLLNNDNNIEYIYGSSLKVSNNDKGTISTQIKAYNGSSSYSKNTFGQLFKWFNECIKNDVEQFYHDDYLFPFSWRHPKYKTYHDVLINQVQRQIKDKLNTDPIKIQFSKNKVYIFKIPCTQLWKQITISTLLPNDNFDVSEGKFSIVNKKGLTVFSVYGDRIMIGQGLDKQKIKEDAIQIDLPECNFQRFNKKLEQFIQSY